MFEWFASAVILYLLSKNFDANNRIKKLEDTIRIVEINSNTNEININQLFFLRETEISNNDNSLPPEYLTEMQRETGIKNQTLAERNKLLMKQATAKN